MPPHDPLNGGPMSHDAGQDMTVKQVAEALNVSPGTIYERLTAGTLPGAYRVGSAWRIRHDALDALRGGALSARGKLAARARTPDLGAWRTGAAAS